MKNTIKKLVTGKGFYAVSALGIICVALSVVMVYRTASFVPEKTVTNSTTTVPTQQAQIPKSDVVDPRFTVDGESATQTKPEIREESTAIEPISTTVNEEEVFSNENFILPLNTQILKHFSPTTPVFDETMNDWRVHKGTDFMAKIGEDVLSVGNGRVSKVVADPSYGYIVEIDYGSFVARYCGLEQGTTLHPETIVKKGDVVGKVADIPCESEMESHLHFEALQNSAYVDCIELLG